MSRIRVVLVSNRNRSISSTAFLSPPFSVSLKRVAKDKLRFKPMRFFLLGGKELTNEEIDSLCDGATIIVSAGEPFVGTIAAAVSDAAEEVRGSGMYRVIGNKSEIEKEAVEQLQRTALQLEGVIEAVGMPDLHPGREFPIGASWASLGFVHPLIVGGDIGCGMSIIRTQLSSSLSEKRIERMSQELCGLESSWEGDIDEFLKMHMEYPLGSAVPAVEQELFGEDFDLAQFNQSLGTVGGGNHFAELLSIEKIENEEIAAKLGLSQDKCVLVVHSGSRGLGEAILEDYKNHHGRTGLKQGSPEFEAYIKRHDMACAWAKRNRALIATRFLSALGSSADVTEVCSVDICHNNVVSREYTDGSQVFLHRKGAAPSDQGVVIIPGSRGARSYIVWPIKEQAHRSLYSLAHGAGRKLSRGKALQSMKVRYPHPAKLEKTAMGSVVICEDRDLLYEEAPEAYKEIESIIEDLLEEGLIEIVAVLTPVITYKMRKARYGASMRHEDDDNERE